MLTSAEKVSRIKGISEKKTIFIVDNNLINRSRLRNSIRLANRFMVIGESEYCNCIEKISIINPNILILSTFSDMRKNENIISGIKRDFPLTKILIVTSEFDEKDFLHAINLGVCGYLSLDNSFNSLVEYIDDIGNIGVAFDKKLAPFVYRILSTMGDNFHPCHFDKSPQEQFNLTKRELEVASVMSESSQYKDVAKKLHISPDTVKMHMSHIYKKLGVSTKHEAILKLQSKILEFKLNSNIWFHVKIFSMEKIVVNLIGGVGNQMFQYALGYVVSKKTGFELLVDVSGYNEYKTRNFELNKFGIDVKIADIADIYNLNRKHLFKKTLYKDKKKTFCPQVLKIKNSAYLKGFWQSEKYFADYRYEILKLYEFRDKSFIVNNTLLSDIQNTNSVSINLRLGDYVTNKENRRIHFVCKKDYYKNAINYIVEKIDNPKFFVFSDDIDGSKEYLPEDYEYTFANTANWQEDMYFMSLAKHNIVANSSFSWWAAWLNQNPAKVTIAPSRWFTREAKINDKDFVPKNWVKVAVN